MKIANQIPLFNLIKKLPGFFLLIYIKSLLVRPQSQADESYILRKLISRHPIPRTFIEFGFSGWEFNCAEVAADWDGLLIDGDPYNIYIARALWRRNVTIKKLWIDHESIGSLSNWLDGRELGILSIDVDGNDYWFLKSTIYLRPAIIVVEYNSTFGLRPLASKYDRNFIRSEKHSSNLYYGASLKALHLLAQRNGYSLVELSNSGVNAFFLRNDLLVPDDVILTPETSFKDKFFPDGSRASDLWPIISSMEYVDVSND